MDTSASYQNNPEKNTSDLQKVFKEISNIFHAKAKPKRLQFNENECVVSYVIPQGDVLYQFNENFEIWSDLPERYSLIFFSKDEKLPIKQYYFDTKMNFEFGKEKPISDQQVYLVEVEEERKNLLKKLTDALESEDQNLYTTNQLPELFSWELYDILKPSSEN